ncbi:ABC transporter ATP-binding protein [Curvivirga sp.]|uniref:ABC transporter ATP-binding protein n=1 Tax=Curvivirga sp. TaxID=2856848 RepID=UPI003B5BCBC0
MLMPIISSSGAIDVFGDIPLLGVFLTDLDKLDTSERIFFAASFMLVMVILRGILLFFVAVIGILLPIDIQRELVLDGYKGLLNISYNYYKENRAGTLLTRCIEHPNKKAAVLYNVANIVTNLCLILIYFALILFISPLMTLVASICVVLLLLLVRVFSSNPLKNAGKEITDARVSMNNAFHQTVQGIKLIKLRNAEGYMLQWFDRAYENFLQASKKSQLINAAFGPGFTTLAGSVVCGALIIASLFLSADEGETTAAFGQILLFIICLYRLLTPAINLNQARAIIDNNSFAMNDYDVFCQELTANRSVYGSEECGDTISQVNCVDLSYQYQDKADKALQDINITILSGEMIALVGASGSGKSTLVDLLSGIMKPTSGRILVDDVDLSNVNIPSWRKRIGVVSQETYLLNDSLRNNLTFGLENVDEQSIIHALEQAECMEFVKQLPDGLDTILGERGAKLSGGQQQRISIARTLLSNPDIIIFDEATANLDSFAEKAIQENLLKLKGEKILIVIAHRLSTVKDADRILVMNKGKIVEEGAHKDLERKAGLYSELLRHQDLIAE